MEKLINHSLYMKEVFNHGRGIFVNHRIKKGDVIETTPIIEFCDYVSEHFVKDDCGEKFLAWKIGDNGIPLTLAVGCGLIMFCNHSDTPNAIIKKNFTDKTVSLISIANIEKDQQVLIKYTLTKTF